VGGPRNDMLRLTDVDVAFLDNDHLAVSLVDDVVDLLELIGNRPSAGRSSRGERERASYRVGIGDHLIVGNDIVV
jgi:hypothetical protein